ncbi:hypothetical protein FRB95_013904 [Tulasnella sp. JGI-2019a]|nr:hypothetical protein FRB95_013904 [Tulasnella sp. JGI-2019a]
MSHLHPHHLTSCFSDVILVPLATWIFLVLFVIALFTDRAKYKSLQHTSSTPSNPPPPSTRPARIYTALYSFLIFAAIAMTALEIARLLAANLAIGLLPFTFIGIIFATAIHFSQGVHGRIPFWPILNIAYWLLIIIFLAVKISEELEQGTHARENSMYKESDQIIDVGTMIGVYAVLAILDAVRIFYPQHLRTEY